VDRFREVARVDALHYIAVRNRHQTDGVIGDDGTAPMPERNHTREDCERTNPDRAHAEWVARVALQSEPRPELFHTPGADGIPYATIAVDGHLETWPIHSGRFRHDLERRVYRATGRLPSAHRIETVLRVLTGEALFNGPERLVFTRLAEHEDAIYLDLGDPAWRAVEVTRWGWRVVARPAVKFRRARGMLPLPLPTRGGSIHDLRPFVNVADEDDYRLLLAWLLAALRPQGPYPILILHGEQGAAKSTTARVLRLLCDPNQAPLRAPPREVRDLMITAANSWVACFDNLDHLAPWLGNAICRLATGGGFGTRRTYTDDEEVLFDATRPIIITGIEELATRGDVLDRALVLHLPAIPSARRQTEAGFWAAFTQAQGAVLGGLLDALVGALEVLPRVHLRTLPRMADFARFGVALERAVGWPVRAFLAAYEANRAATDDLILETSVVARPLREFLTTTGAWTGTTTDLLDALMATVAEPVRRKREWPKTASALGAQLHRLAPMLRALGMEVVFHRGARRRTITLMLVKPGTMPSSASSMS
jgi:hypothetical protein